MQPDPGLSRPATSGVPAAGAQPLDALLQAEASAVRERRRQVLGGAEVPQQMALPRVGLALSGGGVRSATFALGLLRGMAQSRASEAPAAQPHARTLASEGLLGRLDYLSSVSGGGYVAAMFGRLVMAHGLLGAQARLARSDSAVLGWLRRNGRYLTPSGSRDLGIAVVTFLRALLAIHAEFMVACMLLGLVVIGPHLWQHTVQALDAQGWEPWLTAWWALAALGWLAVAPGLIAGYWAARDGPEDAAAPQASPSRWRLPRPRDLLFVLIAAVLAVLALHSAAAIGALDVSRHALSWPMAGALALVSLVMGQALVQLRLAVSTEPRGLAVARVRQGLTHALRAVTLAALGLASFGALDRLSWWILVEVQSGNPWLWGGVGAGGLAVLVLRSLMQPLQQLAANSRQGGSAWLPRLLNAASLAGLLALVLLWLVLLQWFVFAPSTFDTFTGVPAWMRAGVVALAWGVWVLLTAGNADMANTSSLHSFYRARLTRAYLAVGNPQRGLEGTGPLRADVTAVVEGDDTRLASYRPEAHGGPIHLVNTCLNQTRDDASGLYNADRKGTALTASWRGLEVGPRRVLPAAEGGADSTGSLGRWVAISGAAASPGAGAYTSRGLALLVYFLGVRLGFWLRCPGQRTPLRWLSDWAWRWCPKPLMLASEASATFFGEERPWWYLSDGGHFENTGVYALLKRELDFIVLSDASCDPHYHFGDLENLVRKARIDFGAEIDFYSREEADRLFALTGTELTVLSPEDLSDNHSCRGVMLARIRYRERPGRDGGPGVRPEGTLLVVKPNLHDALDLDLLSYARQHPQFPHESTGDQSFDEAQWESYHRLGEDFGRALHDRWLAQLPGWREPACHGLRVAARLREAVDARAAPAAGTEPLWRRSARATALGTTLGVGASGTVLLSMWQVQEGLARHQADEQAQVRQIFTEASKGLQEFDGACPKLPEHVATQVSRLLDLRGSPALRPLEQGGVDRLAERLTQECRKPVAAAGCEAAHERLHHDLCAQLVHQDVQGAALDYWRPGLSRVDQIRETHLTWQRLEAYWRQAWPWDPARPAATGPAAARPADAASASPPPLREAAASSLPSSPASSPSARDTPNGAGRQVRDTCVRQGEPTRVFVLVYDEDTSLAAMRWRQTLLDDMGSLGPNEQPVIQVLPVRNVARDAQIRQQRAPVPWPRPTLVLHDVSSRACALVLGRRLPIAGNAFQGDDAFWVRDLAGTPRHRRAGVIEVWLPPDSLADPGTPGLQRRR